MNPLQKILQSQKPEHVKAEAGSAASGAYSCPSCACKSYWKSVYGGVHCWSCEPAPVESMVAETNLRPLEDQSDEGWVECEDGKFRDYFMDGGRMWIVDEGADYVRFSLVTR